MTFHRNRLWSTLFLCLAVGPLQAMAQTQRIPGINPVPLEATPEQMRQAVATARAGRRLTPKSWANGSRVAVSLLPLVDEVFKTYQHEFDGAYQEGTMFVLTMPPHITGHRSRIVAWEELITYMRSKPGVWFANCKLCETGGCQVVHPAQNIAPAAPGCHGRAHRESRYRSLIS